MSRRVFSLGACLAISLATLLPMSAQAHKSVRVGRYECYQRSGIDAYPAEFNLKIKSATRYVLVKKGETFGGGRYVHDGKKLIFKSGYLHNNNWKATHDVDGTGEHRIEMQRTTEDGTVYIWCQEP